MGRQGGRQSVNLQGGVCLKNQIGTAIHELMHALGFTHEQNRYERDDFVHVLWENIKPGLNKKPFSFNSQKFFPNF